MMRMAPGSDRRGKMEGMEYMDYFNTPKEKWQEFLKIRDEDIPNKLIIDGKIDYPKWIKIVLDRVKNGRASWHPNLIMGEYNGDLIGYGVCFGGSVASQYTHIYCKMGTKKMVQIGCGGGLQPDIEPGDIIVSEAVLCRDGSARFYKHISDLVEFDRELIKDVIEKIEERGIPYHLGKTICMFDILLWEAEDFKDLSRKGFLGADMESGSVCAVSKYFGAPATSFYVCSDNSASGKDLFYKQTEEEQKKVKMIFDAVLNIALEL